METSTPATVPVQTVPFFSSTVTVSLDSFIRKRTSFIVALTAKWRARAASR